MQLLSAIEEAETGHGTARLTEICLSAYGELAAAQFQITQLRARIHVLAARRTVMIGQNISRPGREKPTARRNPGRAAPGQGRHRWRLSWLASAAAIAAALTVAACGSSSAGGAASATPGAASGAAVSGSALETTTISGAAVLTNAQGFTLYWFAPDTATTTSRCNGSCAQIWPPVNGPATAGPGIPGRLGTITRSDGATQATYDGHPLYTYAGDTRPGQANGNNLNLNGGLWHEVTAGAGPS